MRRFHVTTKMDPVGIECSRVIIVLTPELLHGDLPPEMLDPIRGKLVLGIKLRDCIIPEVLANEVTSYIDLTTTDLNDLTYHEQFMKTVYRSLKLPVSVCS